ncbi:uncharacterized protein A4U43_C08F13500 [Asparagus officinalis]|nr:uncharacterized protein A4U43_C08F13500 [Asparagus officinalis]
MTELRCRPGRQGNEGRYTGVRRCLVKQWTVGLVCGGDGEGVSWKWREMEGRVLKWRIGGRIWVSYCPNEVKSECFESRVVEWRDEVILGDIAM